MTSLRNHRDVHTLSMNCSGNIDHPVRALHLRYFHSFLHCQTQAPVVVQQRVSQPVQELHLKNLDGLLHSLHCVPVSVKQLHHHSVEELKLRHLHVLDENLLELVADDHRDVHNRLSHRRGGQYLYPALAWRQAAPGEPVLPSIQGFALPPQQVRTLAPSALPPTVQPSAAHGGLCETVGTSITCSATRRSRGAKKSTNCSTICGTAS